MGVVVPGRHRVMEHRKCLRRVLFAQTRTLTSLMIPSIAGQANVDATQSSNSNKKKKEARMCSPETNPNKYDSFC